MIKSSEQSFFLNMFFSRGILPLPEAMKQGEREGEEEGGQT